MWLRGFGRVARHRDRKRCLIISIHTLTNISRDTIKDGFCQQIHVFFNTAQRKDILVLAGNVNGRRTSTREVWPEIDDSHRRLCVHCNNYTGTVIVQNIVLVDI